jgi:hypothetical protein
LRERWGEGQEMEKNPKKERKKTRRRQWNLESKNFEDRSSLQQIIAGVIIVYYQMV